VQNDREMSSNSDEDVYQYLVVDSGPIIRLTGLTTLWKKTKHFYTVPAVLQEIRDAKARTHLESLPFTLIPREASREGIHAVVAFARQTGDYNSLSSVDIQVLGLLYDLEREGCGRDMTHIRTTPKRTLGLGRIESLVGTTILEEKNYTVDNDETEDKDEDSDPLQSSSANACSGDDEVKEENKITTTESVRPKSWAALVNPRESSITPALSVEATRVSFVKMDISSNSDKAQLEDVSGGQFSDAEDDDQDSLRSISDEECDAYILDPDEFDPRKLAVNDESVEEKLRSEFPSLPASFLVSYDGSDCEGDDRAGAQAEARDDNIYGPEDESKLRSLHPISKSGKLYNSFTNYGDLMKPKPARSNSSALQQEDASKPKAAKASDSREKHGDKNQSRIMGGMGFAGQGDDVEDDGEGWITNTEDISSMKAVGALDPSRNPTGLDGNAVARKQTQGPLICQRAACTTTDFAMQNVILQMNLELLSVDGMKVRKLKNWVTRCGACFTVYTNSDNPGPLGKRLFCERCGSDMMQRIAASVDGKTGRLRLHLSKKYKHNLRGTKFSLPKPGSGCRFQGDLLLREDQLLMGAWSQKVKMRSGGKARDAAQSMFGRDIATNVGCNTSAVNVDDIRVGFGRRNPNAAKGRERRGKKKKSDDKACGLRRY
jgi:RNA-binding protein NOB1